MTGYADEYRATQEFGSNATGGVIGDDKGTEVQVLVAMYGDYQHDGHAGKDYGCPVGTPVRALKAGTVVWCDWDVNLPGDDSGAGYASRWDFYRRFGGRILLLQHGPSEFTAYCHLSEFKVGYGQQVNAGDLIALSGDSSAGQDGQLGPHLHLEYLTDLSYSTGNGRIYGRENPDNIGGGLAAQGNITQTEEDMPLNQDDKNAISVIVRDWGNTAAQAALSAPLINWPGLSVSVVEQLVFNAQGLAMIAGKVAGLETAIGQLAGGQGLDHAAIVAAADQGVHDGLAGILAGLQATITIQPAPELPGGAK